MQVPIVMMVVGLATSLWALAVMTNWRGYAERQAKRSIRVTSIMYRGPLRVLPAPDSKTFARCYRLTQLIVSVPIAVVGAVLGIVGVVAFL
jgi:hypothetical protein